MTPAHVCAAALLLPFAVVMLALWSLSVPRVTVANVQPSDEQGVSWTAATGHG